MRAKLQVIVTHWKVINREVKQPKKQKSNQLSAQSKPRNKSFNALWTKEERSGQVNDVQDVARER